MESRTEKRTKGEFLPVGGKRLLCFLDDLNMPANDLFGSQPPLELLRLWIDYGFWFDHQKQTKKFVKVRKTGRDGSLSVWTTWVFSCRTCSYWRPWGPLVAGGLTFLGASRVALTSST